VLADLHAGGNLTDPRVLANCHEMEGAIACKDALGEATWLEVFKQFPRRAFIGIVC
jgi:hypothetical protein